MRAWRPRSLAATPFQRYLHGRRMREVNHLRVGMAGAPCVGGGGILLGRGCATSLGSVRQFLAAPVFGAGAGAVFRVAGKSSDGARRRARPAVADGECVLSAAEIGNFYYGPGHPMKPHRKLPPALSCRLFLHRLLWIAVCGRRSMLVVLLRLPRHLTVAALWLLQESGCATTCCSTTDCTRKWTCSYVHAPLLALIPALVLPCSRPRNLFRL